jgi:uncharacterized RDD family membrane protein YckC
MTERNKKLTIGLRLASMLVDHFAMTMVMMIIVLPSFAMSMFNAFNLDHDPTHFGFGSMSFLMFFGFSAYFNKDIFNGRSPAKRILKLQVIDNKTGTPANPLRCLARNLTIVFWPIEVIFVLVNPQRRLGDYIAGTRIEYTEQPEKTKMDWPKFSIALLISIGFSFFMSFPFQLIGSSFSTDKVDYIEDSFNEEKSNLTTNFFITELNGLLKKADFRVYDKITNDDRNYVSGIVYFTNRSDYENFEVSEQLISNLLNNRFEPEKTICFLKFVYKESGSISSRQKLYDSRTVVK